MISSAQILFFFSAIGAFNGLFLALYFAAQRSNILQHRLLAALILMVTVRISKSVWFYFDPTLTKLVLQVGLSACFLIGPLLYCYVKSCLHPDDTKLATLFRHLGVCSVLIVAVGIAYPYQTNIELWGTFYKIINWVWAGYILATALLLYPNLYAYIKGKRNLSREEIMCANVFVGTSLIWLAFFTSSYTSYIIGALSFSSILYLSVLAWLLSRGSQVGRPKTKPYANKVIDKSEEQALSNRLASLMKEEALYRDANLTLSFLARKVGVTPHHLSQLLNINLQKSFAYYVNEWRIQEAKRLLLQERRMSMEVIAEQSGFNSQSTFYSAFKQFEGTTPAKFRKAKNIKVLDDSLKNSDIIIS